jgi:glutathionyl-hydroquinone reductase
LWDKKNRSIVNNESADILQMLHRDFAVVARNSLDLRPAVIYSGMRCQRLSRPYQGWLFRE